VRGSTSPTTFDSTPTTTAPLGLHTEIVETVPGPIELRAAPDHRVKLHASAPVRGACRRQPFVYTPGDIDLVPAGEADEWEEKDAGASLVVRMPIAFLRSTAHAMDLDEDRVGIEPRHQFKDRHIEHIAWALDAERTAGHPNGLLYAQSLGTALAVHLLGHYPATTVRARGLSRTQLRRVKDYVEAHLDSDLSLDRLAALADLGMSQFKLLFRRSLGVPVHGYVVQRRVERARMLLQRGVSITQAAHEAGFAHGSHLARCMRRVLGVSPTTLRRSA
jgi:AraC family transcriptional regulator